MAIICRTVTKAIRTLLSEKSPNTLHGIIPFIHHSQDSILPPHSYFMQKHVPYFLHHRQLAQITSSPSHSHLHSFLKSIVFSDHFIQPPLNLPHENAHISPKSECLLFSSEEASRTQRFVQTETAKRKLQKISEACISYSKFLELCTNCAQNAEQGVEIVNSLEQSGDVIITGERVYIHPQQVAIAAENVLLLNSEENRWMKELKILEEEKRAIDIESEKRVRREMYCGLGYFCLESGVLFWLTYWELSWDVMEPVCFFVASFYLCAGYVFSLVTKRDLSFESFHAVRFKCKQRKLMKLRNFDASRYEELLKICRPALKGEKCD